MVVTMSGIRNEGVILIYARALGWVPPTESSLAVRDRVGALRLDRPQLAAVVGRER